MSSTFGILLTGRPKGSDNPPHKAGSTLKRMLPGIIKPATSPHHHSMTIFKVLARSRTH